MDNPYTPGTPFYRNFEHRFERLQLPDGTLHAWHCWCGMCDVIKNHAHGALEIVTVDEPSEYDNLYPHGATWAQ